MHTPVSEQNAHFSNPHKVAARFMMTRIPELLALLTGTEDGNVSLKSEKMLAFRRWFYFDEGFYHRELPQVKFIRLGFPVFEGLWVLLFHIGNVPFGYHPKANFHALPWYVRTVLAFSGHWNTHFVFVPFHMGQGLYRPLIRQAVFHAWAHHIWQGDTLGYETDASLFYHRHMKRQQPLEKKDVCHMDLRQMHALRDYLHSDAEAFLLSGMI
jgi:hypothetical protein